MKRSNPLTGVLGVLAFAAAALTGGAATADAVTPAVAASGTAAAAVDPLPRITVSDDPASRHLVDSETGARFIPRGNNYVRLAQVADWHHHATFEPGEYDPARVEAALTYMGNSGYNVVRIFLDPGHPQHNVDGQPHGLGHGNDDHTVGNAAYLDNLADFLVRAAARGIYVLPAMDYYPFNAYYADIAATSAPQQPNLAGWNAFYLQRSRINAKAAYLQNVVLELRERVGAPLMTTLLALETDNEAIFEADQKPFSLTTGRVTGPDGRTYDLAVPAERQALGDNGMVEYANSLVAAVHEVDPDLMVTTGMFTYLAVNKTIDGFGVRCDRTVAGNSCKDAWHYWYPPRPAALSARSDLSFLELHLYPEPGKTLDQNLASVEWPSVTGPVVVGEYGTRRSYHGGDVRAAAVAMRDLQVATCRAGFGGWFYWTWDTDEEAVQREFVTATEQSGAVNGQLAPVVRYDPCLTEPSRRPVRWTPGWPVPGLPFPGGYGVSR
ncbi:hypothetical protein [Jiangella mangrovi]|uniref:Glycoside hydrolase family 5 domain-containing protein n=1 Tax=Jiangella mangrovi TaxID=1524084 RepID=A0A7W9LLM7_9ACTN|nr:hypothetical protein [Jiangella mangrovi]MBB5788380.1 hypothetical protein [Jiangella mangrovi]